MADAPIYIALLLLATFVVVVARRFLHGAVVDRTTAYWVSTISEALGDDAGSRR